MGSWQIPCLTLFNKIQCYHVFLGTDCLAMVIKMLNDNKYICYLHERGEFKYSKSTEERVGRATTDLYSST